MRLLTAIVSAMMLGGGAMADDAVLSQGREMSDAFLDRDLSRVWDAMTPQMREGLGAIAGLGTFRDDLERGFGAEEQVLDEEIQTDQRGLDIYLRTARWTKTDAPMLMQWAFDEKQNVAGFLVQPAPVLAESRFLDYSTKTALQLPFKGEWFVFWGGRTLGQNYHAADRAQRFASDFLVIRNGSSHRGNSADLSSYHCWDQPIIAPAAGTVVTAINNLPDHPIGETDPQNPAGNHVVVDFGNGEFAFLGHMRQDSVTVAPGDAVSQGQELGRCGNSGNTSEPHLHFHLQTTSELATGEGLPAFFENYRANGTLMDHGEPARGQTISLNAP